MLTVLKSTEKEEVVHQVIHHIEQNYVFPEVAEIVKEKLTSNFKEGQYSSISDEEELCKALTKDLQELTKDRHLVVLYRPPTPIKSHEKSMHERILEDEI